MRDMKQFSVSSHRRLLETINILFLLFVILCSARGRRYKVSWSDLDRRPLPRWYHEAKVGVLVHWGVYSVPSCCGASQWFQANWRHGHEDVINFMKNNYPPGFQYSDFGPKFTAELFNPVEWAKFFKKVGAKYVILTSKNHDGFALFPSNTTKWNSVDIGPHRDLVGSLGNAVKDKGLKFGIYYSLIENPPYDDDKTLKFKPYTYRNDVLWPELKQLVRNYKPSIIWADGHWEADDTNLNSTHFLAWLYNKSPVKDEVVINDRWGKNTPCKHGDFHNCMNGYNPVTVPKHKWESVDSIDTISWGYRQDMKLEDVLTIKQLLRKTVTTVSRGGNILINIGATKEGTIPLILQDRLRALGHWLDINGEAIYGTSPWKHQKETINEDVWYTCTRVVYDARRPVSVPTPAEHVLAIYALIMKWPRNNLLMLKDITSDFHTYTQVGMLGYEDTNYLNWTTANGLISILLPDHCKVKSKHAWTLKFTHTG